MATTAPNRVSETTPRPARARRRRRAMVALTAALSLLVATVSATSAGAETVVTPVTTGSTAEIDLVLERQVGPVDYGFGPSSWRVYLLSATNLSDVEVTIGLGVDLAEQGVVEDLRYSPTLLAAGFGENDLASLFTATISPGETFSSPVPEWPGMTYVFLQHDPAPQEIARTTSDGLHVPFFEATALPDRVTVATLSGPELFPGLTATVTASGLQPGAEYGVWMAPGLDYFSFMLSGALLPEGAFEAGSAVVAADGSYSATVSVPLGTTLGRHQLVVGDPATRSWPAGTIAPFAVTAPPAYAEAATPSGAGVTTELSTPSATISLAFADVTQPGTTSVAVAATGPVLEGFQFAATPAYYFHLDTTAIVEGPIKVCIAYDPATVSELPRLFHFEAGVWVDITTSSATGRVCGMTDSFSPFVLGLPNGVELANKQQCKDGGWRTSTLPPFVNQGDCVSWFEARGR